MPQFMYFLFYCAMTIKTLIQSNFLLNHERGILQMLIKMFISVFYKCCDCNVSYISMSRLHGEAAQPTANPDSHQATAWQTGSMPREKGNTGHVNWNGARIHTHTNGIHTFINRYSVKTAGTVTIGSHTKSVDRKTRPVVFFFSLDAGNRFDCDRNSETHVAADSWFIYLPLGGSRGQDFLRPQKVVLAQLPILSDLYTNIE